MLAEHTISDLVLRFLLKEQPRFQEGFFRKFLSKAVEVCVHLATKTLVRSGTDVG